MRLIGQTFDVATLGARLGPGLAATLLAGQVLLVRRQRGPVTLPSYEADAKQPLTAFP